MKFAMRPVGAGRELILMVISSTGLLQSLCAVREERAITVLT